LGVLKNNSLIGKEQDMKSNAKRDAHSAQPTHWNRKKSAVHAMQRSRTAKMHPHPNAGGAAFKLPRKYDGGGVQRYTDSQPKI
jgi:predicted neuraminidase